MSIMDSARRMVEGAFSRGKGKGKPLQSSRTDAAAMEAIGTVKRRFDLARESRQENEGQWAIALSYLRTDSQWIRFQDRRIEDARTADAIDSYKTVNLYQGFIVRAAARACARRPDVAVLPKGEREIDAEAASELDAALNHYDSVLKLQDSLRRNAVYALAATTGYLKVYWDDTNLAEVPIEWADPVNRTEPTRYGMRPVGDICAEVTPGHEVYLDPGSSSFDTSPWVLQVRRVPTESVEDRYHMEVSSDWEEQGRVAEVKELVQTTFWHGATKEDGRTTVYEMYERPCARYPKGRTVVCTQSTLLVLEDSLPDGVVPFIPLGWLEDPFSPYDLSIGQSLAPLQSMLNGTFSQEAQIVSLQKAWLTRTGADGAGADLTERVKDRGWFVEVWHDKNEQAPNLVVPNMDTGNLSNSIERIIGFMSDVSGIHDVSGGPDSPSGEVTSGVAIRMKQDADQQLMALFHIRVEEYCRQRAERIGHLIGLHVLEPRVWGLDASHNADKPGMRVSDMSALRRGGLAAVVVQPGSGTPQLPEMQDQEVMNLVGAGLLSPQAALKAMKSPVATRAGKIEQDLQEEAERAQVIAAQLGNQIDGQEGAGGGDTAGM